MEGQIPITPKRQWLGQKPLLIIGCLVVLGLVGAGAWLVLRSDSRINPELAKSLDAAAAKQLVGDYQAVINDLTAVEGQAKTRQEKVHLYSEIAAAASSIGDLDKALEYYDKKHQADPETKKADGYLIGVLYERKNDPQKALEYYRLYADYLKTIPDSEMQGALQASLDETIRRLGEQAP